MNYKLSPLVLVLIFGFVGGYVDAASYVLAKTFTGHATGNSVLAAISLAERNWSQTATCTLAIIAYFTGIPLHVLLQRLGRRLPFLSLLQLALLVEAVLIVIAISIERGGWHIREQLFIFSMALALGVQNAALRKAGTVSVHTTFVTGLLTRFFVDEFEEPKHGADEPRMLGFIWLSFVIGALVSAVMTMRLHSAALFPLVAMLLGTALFV